MNTFLATFFTIVCLANADLDKKIGEACTSDKDCMNTWSFCSDQKKCTCIEGYAPNAANLCKAKKLYCPSFLLEGLSFAQTPGDSCEAENIVNSDDSITIKSNCSSSSHFCFIHSNAFTEQGKLFGHCCPKPPSDSIKLSTMCPGTEKTGGLCPTDTDENSTCPLESHLCEDTTFNSIASSCCPMACRIEGTFKVAGTGRCMKYVGYDQECEYTAQCDPDATCLLFGPKKACKRISRN